MSKPNKLSEKWLKDKAPIKAAEDAEPDREVAIAMIEARKAAGLSQEQLAHRMKTTISAIIRLESGETRATVPILERFAASTDTRLKISFEPIEDRS